MSTKMRKIYCYFCKNGIDEIDYKDKALLTKFTTPSGRILSSRITKICPKHQRKIQRAVKRAREIALIPFVEITYR